MSLTGWPLLVVLIVAAVALGAATVLVWNRGGTVVRWTARVVAMLLLMVAGAVIVADQANRVYLFYSSWSDLLGRTPADHTVRSVERHTISLPPDLAVRGVAAARQGHGVLIELTLPGRRSGISRPAFVYLPAAYFTAGRDLRFPVIEFFHGYPGGPRNWTVLLNLQSVLDTEIAAHRVPPVIGVVPTDNAGRSSECVNAVRGAQTETYLAVDVPGDITGTLRVLPGASWAAIGYSTGGFCAVNLALHHPERYAAAASLSGYFTALQDPSTGNLYRGRISARRLNSPTWWVVHRRATTPIYVFAPAGDTPAMHEITVFSSAARRGHVPVTVATLPGGGHNFSVWQAALPPALDWLARHLPGPLAPPLTLG